MSVTITHSIEVTVKLEWHSYQKISWELQTPAGLDPGICIRFATSRRHEVTGTEEIGTELVLSNSPCSDRRNLVLAAAVKLGTVDVRLQA